jgi:hypothetical protein
MLPKRGSNGDDRFRLASLIGTIQPEVVMVRRHHPGLGGNHRAKLGAAACLSVGLSG